MPSFTPLIHVNIRVRGKGFRGYGFRVPLMRSCTSFIDVNITIGMLLSSFLICVREGERERARIHGRADGHQASFEAGVTASQPLIVELCPADGRTSQHWSGGRSLGALLSRVAVWRQTAPSHDEI
jgi:hypothetical protein